MITDRLLQAQHSAPASVESHSGTAEKMRGGRVRLFLTSPANTTRSLCVSRTAAGAS